MSTRKRQKKRKARSRKNKQPAVTLKTDSTPQKPKTTVEDKAQSSSTPTAPPTKDVITDPKSTSENNDSAKILLDGESDNNKSGEVGKHPDEEKPSQIRAAHESSGKGLLNTKKLGKYFITTIEVIAAAFVIPTAFVLIIDLEDRQSQRIAQAWGLVTQQAPGNSGKIEALEYLNSDDCERGTDRKASKWEMFKSCSWASVLVTPKRKVNLKGIDLSKDTHKSSVYLYGLELPHAGLTSANLSGADLSNANLYGAYLYGADLSNTSLSFANLNDVLLDDTDLSGADLIWSKMSGAKGRRAIFEETNIFGSDLSKSVFLDTDFSKANFDGSDLSESVFWEGIFVGAHLVDNDLSNTYFSRTDMRGVDFSISKLMKGSDWENSDFENIATNILRNTVFNRTVFSSSTPYRNPIDRIALMGWKYHVFPWPIDAKSGAAYWIGEEPIISEDLLAHFTEFDELCTWAPGLKYVECLGIDISYVFNSY